MGDINKGDKIIMDLETETHQHHVSLLLSLSYAQIHTAI